MSKLARMRTLDECFAEIKAMDENTAISKYYIRQLDTPTCFVGKDTRCNVRKKTLD